MTFIEVATLLITCLILPGSSADCMGQNLGGGNGQPIIAGIRDEKISAPSFTGEAVNVVLSAESALVWDEKTGEVLYEKEAEKQRPVASLSKLMSALAVREMTSLNQVVEIPKEVKWAQRKGADIKLPVGQRVEVRQLLEAGLIASANDAMVALAVGISGSEEEFVKAANNYARQYGFNNTRISNATGLDGGEQYSTARDMMGIFARVYKDSELRRMLASKNGVLVTKEGTRLNYKSTNKLWGTYFPVLAAKTGYTVAAGENLVVMTYGDEGQRIGAVVLGSEERFYDMKVLVEWVWRNFSWS